MRNINMYDYESELVKSDKPVMMDFYADWCGPCKMISPVMEQLDKKFGDDLTVVKVDVDKQKALANEFDVMSIPTVILMKDGAVVDKSIGARPLAYYESLVSKNI